MSTSPSDAPTVKLYAIQDKLNAFIQAHLGYAAVDIESDVIRKANAQEQAKIEYFWPLHTEDTEILAHNREHIAWLEREIDSLNSEAIAYQSR